MTTTTNGHCTLATKIEELGPWFHNLHLPGNIETAPDHMFGDFPRYKWEQIAPHIPADLTGWRVLDIGCNAGYYSFALAARGATVLGIDTDEHYLRQAQWAKEVKGADTVEFRQGSVYEAGRFGAFDLVLFMGVFYHLRHPLLALDILGQLEPRLMVFQTLSFGSDAVAPDACEDRDFQTRDRLADPAWPHMAFIETTFCDDPTNWWVPNHAAIEAMLRSAGFRVTGRPGHEIYLCTADDTSTRWRQEDEAVSLIVRGLSRNGG
ncbi:TIGR04290 family methyltransferase [Lutibaculum baratangense]|uniref:Methyltransferase type 11 n=1 Tax=Lutibaculum baratangense AMV1 TaxID=631454 RepID=V4RQ39_9HYPH|nr:TIGR04290 family methyltransferase [Lutibaculum baratangense]ESR25300.1 Methyltransferase type 11 [Lutibaculum baratangense AMV1]